MEAGEKLGFLPGEMKDKLDPYLQPLYDALQDMIPAAKLKEYMENNVIQIAPLAFMRGRTLNDAVIILDEAQNTTTHQIKMFLTRLGMNAKMIVTGDVTQIDLPPSTTSGLIQAMQILKGVNGIGKIEFTKKDIVRHKLVQRIVEAYDKFDDKRKKEAVIIPIGGGGLISGVAYAIKNLNPNIRVYGVQAKGAPSMLNSIEHGKIERLEGVRTIADGIAVKEPGIHTFDLCQQYVDEIVSVTDDEISTAILALIEQHKLIAEGAGAVAVAAAMFNKVPIKGKKVICLISGGNIDVNILSRVIGRGLQKSGRSCSMTIELVDKPGQLQHVSEIIASTGANVVSVYHERVSHTADINGCYLRLEMETRNQQQINEIRQLLTVSGYKIVEG